MAAARPWLIVERLGDEVLVYDQRSHRAHALSGAAAWLFAHEHGLSDLAPKPSRRELNEGRAVLEALDLDVGATRRRMRRSMIGAATIAALAVTIAAPRKAAAASPCGTADCSMAMNVTMHLPCTTVLSTCGHCAIQVGGPKNGLGVCL